MKIEENNMNNICNFMEALEKKSFGVTSKKHRDLFAMSRKYSGSADLDSTNDEESLLTKVQNDSKVACANYLATTPFKSCNANNNFEK